MKVQAERWMLLTFGALLWSAVSLAAQTPTFSVQRLGTILGGVTAGAYGINSSGEAVGSSGGGTSACPYGCAVIWHDGAPTVLAVKSTFGSQAVAINNAGQIVGAIENSISTAVVWNNGTPTLLPSPDPQSPYTSASSINDAGEVVGVAYNPDNSAGQKAIVWNGLTPTVLDAATGCSNGNYASGINSHGTVVGVSLCPFTDASDWHGTTPTLLGYGKPYAVNNTGLIVGLGTAGAAAWVNGIATPLKPLTGVGVDSSAAAVNNRGIIVGRSPYSTQIYHAVLWSSTSAAPQDLNRLISLSAASKYVLTEATGINDGCTIVANGFLLTDLVNTVAFLLKPLDPSSCESGL